MNKLLPTIFSSVFTFLLLHPGLRAEVIIGMERSEAGATQEDFHFKTVAAPRAQTATGAIFTLVDGTPDRSSGSLNNLHDGKLPDEDDQPGGNFFFQAGGDGGRILVDLGKPVPMKEIATYSRHPGTRAPQVYKIYASTADGDAASAPPPRHPQAPPEKDWQLVADVDTRTKFGNAGGQYGVSVTDTSGLVANSRYLLFDVSPTEKDDAFGLTFFSEINVINRDAPAAGAIAIQEAKKTFNYDQKGFHLTFTSDDPAFDPKEQERLVNTFFATYPPMVEEFNKNAAKSVRISIERKSRVAGGVAATTGNVIHCNPDWFRRHPEDIDVITHEAMHVVQAYRQWDPAWLREGIADYARQKYGVNNPAADWTMPAYKSGQSYKDAYRVTARFLVWLEKKVKPGIVVTLDQAMREGTYSPEIWKQQTGKTVDELWQDYSMQPDI